MRQYTQQEIDRIVSNTVSTLQKDTSNPEYYTLYRSILDKVLTSIVTGGNKVTINLHKVFHEGNRVIVVTDTGVTSLLFNSQQEVEMFYEQLV